MDGIWLNGVLLDAGKARIDPADRGVLLGDGLFETIAVRNGRILRVAAHEARLKSGCETLRLPCPAFDLEAAGNEVLRANGLKDAVLRVTLTRGAGPRGLLPPETPQPTLIVSASLLPPPRPPAHCIVATVTRRNEHSPLSRVKSLNYLDGILARQEAAGQGADDALMLNGAGALAEATAANLFAVIGGQVVTPPVADGAMPGVRRAEILAATGGVERRLWLEDLERADEVFLTSCLEIRPVASVNGRATKGPDSDGIARRIAADSI